MDILSIGLTLLASTPCNWHPYWFHKAKLFTDNTSHHFTERDSRRRHKSLPTWERTQLITHFNLLSTRMTHFTYFCYTSQIRIWNYPPRMDVAVKILNVHLQPIRDWEDTILFYIERTELTVFSLFVRYTMCISLTPVLYFLTTVIIEVYSQCFTESVSFRDIGKSTSSAEISSPSSL